MAQQQQQQQSSGDTSSAPIWIIALLFMVSFFIWKAGHNYIVALIFLLDLAQAKLAMFFVHQSDLTNVVNFMQTVNYSTVEWQQLVDITSTVGRYMRYPVVALLGILAVILYNSDITIRFRKTYSMKTLGIQEQKNWPSIMPVMKHDLVSEDIQVGPWAMALTPIEFGRKYGLLKKNDALMDRVLPGQEMTAAIRRGDAKRVFTLQLGPVWSGFDSCPVHVRALIAVFLSRINRDKDTAAKILLNLDQFAAVDNIDTTIPNRVIRKHCNDESVQDILSQHAYLLTVMASFLSASRDDGVVPSSEFLWLKPLDRRLWYMLNSVGRQTPFAEVGGPFAHWLAEKSMGRRLIAPMIDEAIKALEIAVKEIQLSPKEMQGLTE